MEQSELYGIKIGNKKMPIDKYRDLIDVFEKYFFNEGKIVNRRVNISDRSKSPYTIEMNREIHINGTTIVLDNIETIYTNGEWEENEGDISIYLLSYTESIGGLAKKIIDLSKNMLQVMH